MAQIQQIQFDLSGTKGLSNRFYGDKNLITSSPNLRYLGGDGQLAEGIYNPITTLGYLSPANNTTKVVTGTTSYLLSSSLAIQKNIAEATTNAILFSDETITGTAGKILTLDTAIDTSLTAMATMTSILNPEIMYQTNFSSAIDSGLLHLEIRPQGSTTPAVKALSRNTTASGTTSTNALTVPASLTNSTAYVIIVSNSFNSNPNNPTATFGGSPMTFSSTAGSLGGGGSALSNTWYWIFYYKNPTAGYNIVTATFTSSETSMVMYSFVTDNTYTTGDAIISGAGIYSNNLSTSVHATNGGNPYENFLGLAFTYSQSTTHSYPIPYNQQDFTYSTGGINGFGRDSWSYFNKPKQYFKTVDLIKYQINGVPKIFFTKKSTSSDPILDSIGNINMDFVTQDLTWSDYSPIGYEIGLLTNKARSIFVLSDNGFLYVLNGNRVHKIDGGLTGGTTGTITKNVLVFNGSTGLNENVISYIQDGLDFRGKMYIGLHVDSNFDTRTSSLVGKSIPMFVGIYVWNRSSTVASMQDFIELVGAKELKSLHKFQGKPSCFTISVDGYTQFRVWDGTEFKVVKTLGQNAYPVYRRHSVHENGDNIMWLGNDGKIYCYGKIEEGLENALYILGDMSLNVTAGQTYSGSGVFVAANAVETVTSGNQTAPLAFYLSYTDTAGNHLRKWYPYSTDTVATIEQKGHIGNVYTLVKYLPDMSTVKYIDIRCAPTGTGTETIATIKYYFNGSATASITKTITKDQASRGYVRHELNKPYCNAIQMEIEYSTTNTLGVSNDFRPSLAIVNFEDTNTKG